MLICPQCQSENPNINKFCQDCGTSLTHLVCPKCGVNVALSEKKCQNCGTVTGTVWWAIISTDLGNEPTSATGPKALLTTAQQEGTDSSSVSPAPPALFSSPVSQSGVYLDQERRYQLLKPLPPPQKIGATTEVQVRVLDCQPFQRSPLKVGAEAGIAMEIPAIAKTYLALQPQFYEQLPAIHDAWQQGGQQVVLIADRFDWPKLIDQWHDDKTTPLQILHWLYEMAQLWAALEPQHCRQSLLELSNLRVDEDGMLALQRLYAETEVGKPLTLQDLGQVWQRLFQESQQTQFGSLVQLMTELKDGNIQTHDDLRSRLEAIANERQANVTSTTRGGSKGEIPAQHEFPKEPPETATAEPESAATKNYVAPTLPKMDEPQDSPRKSHDMPTLVLPMQLVSLEDAGRTDVGRQRNHNEDFFGIETAINKLEFPNGKAVAARGLYLLCDGIGGHDGGEVASTLAVKTLQQYFQIHWQSHAPLPTEDTIREAVRLTNQKIYDLNQQDARSGIGRMGTTLVMVLLHDTHVAVAHVGDSRLYRFSHKRELEQVSVDHEVGQREILRGVEPEIAYARPDAYQLTQALGPRDGNFVNPDVQFLELGEDTLLILASDGLTDNNLLEQHWQTHLKPLLSSEASLERGVSDLIDLANQYNGHDNITAVVIRVKVRPNLEQ